MLPLWSTALLKVWGALSIGPKRKVTQKELSCGSHPPPSYPRVPSPQSEYTPQRALRGGCGPWVLREGPGAVLQQHVGGGERLTGGLTWKGMKLGELESRWARGVFVGSSGKGRASVSSSAR